MKFQAFADLHFYNFEIEDEIERARGIREHADSVDADVILVAGDILEGMSPMNHFSALSTIFGDHRIIVFCLGNHEFAYKSLPDVIGNITYKQMKRSSEVSKEHIFCLDVNEYIDISPTIRIVGNVLWYDGSMRDYRDQSLLDFARGQWLDKTIGDFNPIVESEKCQKKIIDRIESTDKDIILLTHHVPHRKLNTHPTPSQFSAFSGIGNFLEKLPKNRVKYAVCGHTHRRSVGQVINGVNCINVGHDMYTSDEIQSFTFEL